MFRAVETLINSLQILKLGYKNRVRTLEKIGADDAHVQRSKNASTGLPFEKWELYQWKLVKEQMFPPFFVESEKLCVPAKFLCLKQFAALAKIEIPSAFTGRLEDSILAHLFYELTLILLKDALGDGIHNHPFARYLAGKVRQNDEDGIASASASSCPEAFFKFWCSLPAMPPDHMEEDSGDL
jgi:hypothetical protein